MEYRIPVTVNGNDVMLETDRSLSHFVLTISDFSKLKNPIGWVRQDNDMGYCTELDFADFLDLLPDIGKSIGKKIEVYCGNEEMGTVGPKEVPILEGERFCITYQVKINREPYLLISTYSHSIIQCRQEVMNFVARAVGAYSLLK